MSRMSQKHSRESMEIGTDGMVVIAMVVAAFMLQVWHLKSALLPATDEGVYVLIGKLMLKGYVPHSDFPMWHMPLLPLLSGIGLWFTGSMYPLRIVYLAINCLVAIPLFSSLKRVTSSPLAAMTAIAFYLTFHEMIDHDFRLLAIRQFANVFFILFVWAGICAWEKPWREWVQLLCCIASAMTFLPAALNIAVAATGLVFLAPKQHRMAVAKHYGMMLCCAAICAIMYLLAMDGALREVVFDQVSRLPFSRMARVTRILLKPDALLVALGTTSLLLGIFVLPKLRSLCAAMLAVVLMSMFLATNYFDHYVTIAGPALAFGIAISVLLIRECAGLLPGQLRDSGTVIACSLLVLWQLSIVLPIVSRHLYTPNDSGYRAMLAVLARQPEPVLITQALYAVEADRMPILGVFEQLFRPPAMLKVPLDEIAAAEAEACTIVIDPTIADVVNTATLASWKERYTSVFRNTFATILTTGNPGCDDQRDLVPRT